jgi:hypothetical protein
VVLSEWLARQAADTLRPSHDRMESRHESLDLAVVEYRAVAEVTAVLISGLFLIAGLAAVFTTAGLILASVMSVVEAVWIPAFAIAFGLSRGAVQ